MPLSPRLQSLQVNLLVLEGGVTAAARKARLKRLTEWAERYGAPRIDATPH